MICGSALLRHPVTFYPTNYGFQKMWDKCQISSIPVVKLGRLDSPPPIRRQSCLWRAQRHAGSTMIREITDVMPLPQRRNHLGYAA